jgi:hypothetical protein
MMNETATSTTATEEATSCPSVCGWITAFTILEHHLSSAATHDVTGKNKFVLGTRIEFSFILYRIQVSTLVMPSLFLRQSELPKPSILARAHESSLIT